MIAEALGNTNLYWNTSMNKQSIHQEITPKSTYTIAQFCDANNVSRTHLHYLNKTGQGPRLMRLGRRVLISAEAAADWRRQVESVTAADGA